MYPVDLAILSHSICLKSRLVQARVSLAKVSMLLGHSSVTTTEIYAHLAPNEVSDEPLEGARSRDPGIDDQFLSIFAGR